MEYAIMAAALICALLGLIFRRAAKKQLLVTPDDKKAKKKRKLCTMLVVIGAWLFTVTLLPLLFGAKEAEPLTVEISPERVNLMGLSLSSSVVAMWVAMAVILLLAVLARVFVIPKFQAVPRGVQNVLELMVDGISTYTNKTAGELGNNLSAYLFTIAALMIACAAMELIGVRPPTADLAMTFSMALISFFLINYYAIRHKGFGGRIKSLASPTPVVLPLRMISDVAVPISLACRLFGNMLGGMIVMHLLYSALGSSAIGIPSVIGLYFNVFHPIIQAYIFITLTLTFINEAVE